MRDALVASGVWVPITLAFCLASFGFMFGWIIRDRFVKQATFDELADAWRFGYAAGLDDREASAERDTIAR